MLELDKVKRESAPSGPGMKILVLIDPETTQFGPVFDSLSRNISQGNKFTLVIPKLQEQKVIDAAGLFRFQSIIGPTPDNYEAISSAADWVIIPHISINSLTKCSRLIGDEPLPGIFIHALIKGVPVTVCDDYIQSLNHGDRPAPKKVLSTIKAGLTAIEEFGVKITRLKSVEKAVVKNNKGAGAINDIGHKNVVTNEDVMIAAGQKQKVLNFPKGAIITPLAMETAKQLGIEINLV